MSNFYDNLVSGKYNTYEKIASAEDETVREAISELTQDQIEALAGEIEGITKRASEMNLEETLAYEFEEAIEQTAAEEGCSTKEEPKKEKDSKKDDVKEKEAEEDEEGIEQNASEEELSELEKEMEVNASEDGDKDKDDKDDKDDKEEEDDDDDNQESNFNPKQIKSKEKCAEETEISFEKLSAEEQFEITKQACEEVEGTLAEAGYTLADYVYSFTGLEKHAHEIAEQAEKLASIEGIPALMVANDMLNAMNEIIDAE